MQESCPARPILVCLLLLYQGVFTGCQPDVDHLSVKPDPVYPVYSLNGMDDIHRNTFIAYPRPGNFSVCHGHTCAEFSRVSLSEEEWLSIKDTFSGVSDAPGERMAIGEAIARFERIVGQHVGTHRDMGRNPSGFSRSGQLDCVDEATNTTVYLSILQEQGLLDWHLVDDRNSRGISTLQVLHWTAVIRDNKSGKRYAVDSWFLANGEPPFILPLDEWQAGWAPSN